MNAFLDLCERAAISPSGARDLLGISANTLRNYETGALLPSPKEMQVLKGFALLRIAKSDTRKRSDSSAIQVGRNEKQMAKSKTDPARSQYFSGGGHLPTAIDLFCGAGGLSEGFRQAGFRVLAGNDMDPHASITYRATHKDAAFVPGPIQNIPASAFLGAAKLRKGQLDCLIGGPPCQAYSVYNHQRGMHDERSQLFREYLRIVEGVQPKWIVMENVTGIMSAGNGRVTRDIADGLSSLGYRLEMRILKAEEYGVPQERRRVFFIGNRMGVPIFWPKVTHGKDLKDFTTIRDAIGDLPRLTNGESSGEPRRYRTGPKSELQRELRGENAIVENHDAPSLAPINLERMKYIGEGGSWRDLPARLLPPGMKKARRCDHTKRYGRLRWNGLSSTVLTKCDLHWGAFIHPEQDRILTVREAARLQTFPDWFVFSGPRTEQYVQVGNAVPPLLGKSVASALLRAQRPGRAGTLAEKNAFNSGELRLAI